MRVVSDARGGCHSPDYWAAAQILLTDIDGAYPIAMIAETARADIIPSPGFLSSATRRAGLCGIGFIMQDDIHAQAFAFVGENEACLAADHLVEFLVGFTAVVESFPDVPYVADDSRLHARVIQRGNEGRCLFVQDVPDLVVELAELSALAVDEPPPPSGASPLGVYACRKRRLDLVLVSTDGTQLSSVDDGAGFPIVGHGHVDLAKVYASHLVADGVGNFLCHIGGDGLILLPLPADDEGARNLEGPVEHQGAVAPPIRPKTSVIGS